MGVGLLSYVHGVIPSGIVLGSEKITKATHVRFATFTTLKNTTP